MAAGRDRKDLLLEAGLALASELSLQVVLQRIVDLAVDLTEATYGALGVLGPDRTIHEFITVGVTADQRAAIGHPPSGLGILGALIHDATPLRLPDISRDPRSFGFPPNHPPMRSFLGAPVKAHGRVFGNIYLTEKRGAPEFTQQDEDDLVVLAAQAGVAVANAELYQETRQRERWLNAVSEIAGAILAGATTERIFPLLADRARDLAQADAATIAVPGEPGTLVLRAASGADADGLEGQVFPVDGSLSGAVIGSGEPIRVQDVATDERVRQPLAGVSGIGPALFVPLSGEGRAFGTLAVANRSGGRTFDDRDARMVAAFADQASLALEYARAQQELHRLAVLEDRERIARELHDGVIQSLFAVGMGLQGTAMLAEDRDLGERIEGAVGELDRVIRDLRNYIFGLRPGILADRRLDQALRDLVDDFSARSGVTAVADVDPEIASQLADRAADLVQFAREALSNVGRHALATTCRVTLRRDGSSAVLEIDDDGRGFDPAEVAASGTGQGLPNLRRRAAAVGGELEVQATPAGGATVRLIVPVQQ